MGAPARLGRRKLVLGALAVGAVGATALALYRPFPPDRTPEGAYMRVARGVARNKPADFFAYLETEAQWAAFSIRDARAKAASRISASYPEPQRKELYAQYARFAQAKDGADVFAIYYQERGWARRLRKDLSGVARVEIEGDRASVVTARGTRYPFRRRDNGIWGLTIFTAELEAEADRARKDLGIVEAAADDFDKLARRPP